MVRAVRVLLSVLLGVSVCASCTDGAEHARPSPTAAPTTSAPDPVAGLVAEIGTNRLYAVDRGLGLALQNASAEPIVIRALQLVSPLFAAEPPTEREVTLAPGRRLVLALPYGEVRCDDEPGPTFPVAVVLDDGDEVLLDAAEEYDGAVARLHQRECAAAAVLERVDITFGAEWVQDGIEVRGELRLEQRHPGEPVAIDNAVGNVIFTLVLRDAHPLLEVSDAEPSVSVPVTIRADRCDPHAVAEFKTPFLFLSWVVVGDAEPAPVPLELTGGARQALEELIATCSA